MFERIRSIQQDLAATDDNPDRFTDAGIDLHFGAARLTGPNTVEVDGVGELRSRFILLCTGSRPAVPPIPGLEEAGFLTSETVWDIERAPESLVVIGGGPISIEMSQAFARLGVQTTVLQKGDRILPRDEPGLVARLTERLREDGVDLVLDVDIEGVAVEDGLKVVRAADGRRVARAARSSWAPGARPNIEGLGLEEVGVKVGPRGVQVDSKLRTSVKSVYAAGDLAGRFLFTHSAGYEAAGAIRNMFFPGSCDATDFVPWCTYTDPELAHAGLTAAEAAERARTRRRARVDP